MGLGCPSCDAIYSKALPYHKLEEKAITTQVWHRIQKKASLTDKHT